MAVAVLVAVAVAVDLPLGLVVMVKTEGTFKDLEDYRRLQVAAAIQLACKILQMRALLSTCPLERLLHQGQWQHQQQWQTPVPGIAIMTQQMIAISNQM